MTRLSGVQTALLSAVLLTSVGATQRAFAVQVPVDGATGNSGGIPDSPNDCTVADEIECDGMDGIIEQRAHGCWCNVYEWVPRRVINASDGDVGLVPIDGRGSPVVTAVTEAIGQLHRHVVMFYGDGEYTRHDTMYVSDEEDGSSSDSMGDYVPVVVPLIGKVHFDGDALANGLPGALSQTIDDTYDRGRLAATGLVLKPALVMNLATLSGPTFTEVNRSLFEAAVAQARSTAAYYKLSDYTDMASMSRSWSASRVGDLRGSHCSGYATYFYRAQGLSLPDVTYPADLRANVAELLFDEVRGQCQDETGFWKDLGLAVSGHFSACSNLANQVVNCFGDLGCDNTSKDWRTLVSSGSAVSPDNMLPDSFRYAGTTGYDWDGTVLSALSNSGAMPLQGKLVSHPGLSGDSPTTSSTSASPFQRVEALLYSGGYAQLVESVRL